MTDLEFWKRLKDYLAIEDTERVRLIGENVLEMLGCRLTYEEAEDLKAQLPAGLKEIWNRCPARPKWHREELLSAIREQCGFESAFDAEHAIRAVFATLQEGISPGEAGDVEAQLPKDVKHMWASAQQGMAAQRGSNLKKIVY